MDAHPFSSVAQRNRTILVLALVLFLIWLLWVARGALLPYILALVVGYLLLPAVNWLDKRLRRVFKRPAPARAAAIVVTYLGGIGVVALFISMVVPVFSQQFNALGSMRDTMYHQVDDFAQRGLGWYRENVPADIQAQVDENLRKAGATVGDAMQAGVARTFTFVTGTVGFILGFAVIPFWLFYVMYDEARIKNALICAIPHRLRPDAVNLWHLLDAVLGSYVRGQLLLSVTIGLMAFVGLTLIGVPFPAILALFAALFEFLPFIGPILGAVPAVLVALIQSPMLALWTIVLYLGIQQIENLVLAPRIAGHATELHPAAIMVVLVIGNEVAGLWGMLIAVPLTAIIRDVFRYLYLRLQDAPCSSDEAMKQMARG